MVEQKERVRNPIISNIGIKFGGLWTNCGEWLYQVGNDVAVAVQTKSYVLKSNWKETSHTIGKLFSRPKTKAQIASDKPKSEWRARKAKRVEQAAKDRAAIANLLNKYCKDHGVKYILYDYGRYYTQISQIENSKDPIVMRHIITRTDSKPDSGTKESSPREWARWVAVNKRMQDLDSGARDRAYEALETQFLEEVAKYGRVEALNRLTAYLNERLARQVEHDLRTRSKKLFIEWYLKRCDYQLEPITDLPWSKVDYETRDDKGSKLCINCFRDNADVVTVPCNHNKVCSKCYAYMFKHLATTQVQMPPLQCIICRQNIRQVIFPKLDAEDSWSGIYEEILALEHQGIVKRILQKS